MNHSELNPDLPLLQDAELKDKLVLVRVDHNVVKKGKIKDPFRIDATLPTLYRIVEQGGRPILMTHVGRPRDKKSGKITEDGRASVQPIVDYLERKLAVRFVVPRVQTEGDLGIREMDKSIQKDLRRLKERRVPGIYLPNTRCFQGEEGKGELKGRFASQLASLADVYVNDAFGSWQSHASTLDITRHLPSFAGLLMQKELCNLEQAMNPERPFLSVVAGAKYDTKIGPLRRIHERVDHLILGGVIYNAYLCAKYGVHVEGVGEADVKAAEELVTLDRDTKKILQLPGLIESDGPDAMVDGKHRTRWIRDFRAGQRYGFFLDAAPASFDDPDVKRVISSARTIFVNAVMGFVPHFTAGTERLNREISGNLHSRKLFGGGDTLQELKNLNPGLYLEALDDPSYYYFTGGGTVLKAMEEGSPYALGPVDALLKNRGRRHSGS